ncbi:hypothetical protein PVAG01_03301 [Phlyctema vagabunda]|uniref:Uncharacterized protein n=1 Tax=Phlyctema vagabunda TaxID=108571 RepID=A0ABR4PL02_9HELO
MTCVTIDTRHKGKKVNRSKTRPVFPLRQIEVVDERKVERELGLRRLTSSSFALEPETLVHEIT